MLDKSVFLRFNKAHEDAFLCIGYGCGSAGTFVL